MSNDIFVWCRCDIDNLMILIHVLTLSLTSFSRLFNEFHNIIFFLHITIMIIDKRFFVIRECFYFNIENIEI